MTLVLLAASACSGHGSVGTASEGAPSSTSPLSARAPYLLMSSDRSGWAVWPSGESWVVLHTTDGWADVTNATPVAVPTGGGLILDASVDGAVAVAVEPYDRLVTSPLLTRTGATAAWSPEELPGAVSDSRDAVSTSASGTTVVLDKAGGTLVTGGNAGWAALTDSSKLAPAGHLRLDGVTWADEALGWLTGHGPSGSKVAFQTRDGGHTWTSVPEVPSSAVAALAPCGAGRTWLLPVVTTDGKIVVERTTDGGEMWTGGSAIAAPSGSPVWGCAGDEVWMAGSAAAKNHVFASSDGGATWSDRGRAPAGLTDLTPLGDGTGFATSDSSHHPLLWAVADNGAELSPRALPGWVATLGAQMATS
jgi:hypothetical protein